LLNIFSHAWVPGQIQKHYVLNLGFKKEHIETGFYSCDLNHFETIYQTQKTQKQEQFPKRFLYVGRYYEFKGIKELWQAFIELQAEQPNEWELWCLGVGDIEPINHPKIKHFGFVQPKDLEKYTSQTGVFVLPSRFEPWGVVVHEFAASGFPLLLSNKVGAKEQFLQEGRNGFEFEAENTVALKQALQKIIHTNDGDLKKMSALSNELAQTISPQKWVESLLRMAKSN
jgi:glycosyltransferase involved in cell wall biosynthesis